MRILHITPTYAPAIGGMETVVRELALRLRARGHVADVAHVAAEHAALDSRDDSGTTVWTVPLRPHRLLGLAPSLRRIVGSYDLLHVHDPQLMALTASVALFGGGKPAVLSTHGGYWHTDRFAPLKAVHQRWVFPRALRRYRAILASSESDRAAFAASSDRVVLAENGVDVSTFMRVRHDGAIDPRRWIYWGRLSSNKRLDLVLDAAAALRRLGEPVDLLLCGRDFDGVEAGLRAQVAALGLGEAVQFVPFLDSDALVEELGRRGLFITASEYEGFGLTVIEAMAAGLAVVCRDMAPLDRFVRQDVNGVRLRFDGSDDDLQRLRRLLSLPPAELAALSERNRGDARPYDWSEAVGRFEAFYDRALASAA